MHTSQPLYANLWYIIDTIVPLQDIVNSKWNDIIMNLRDVNAQQRRNVMK